MASLEKLLKSLEAVGFIKRQNNRFLETNILEKQGKLKKISKAEKLKYCFILCECICAVGQKNEHENLNLIKICIDYYFLVSNESDQDLRSTASECLIKLINLKFIDNSTKIQNELLGHIQNNESQYSVKLALLCFTSISHLIRPSRRKAFTAHLIPCLIKLLKDEQNEFIQESIVENIDVLMNNFIKFATDLEVTSLMKTFINNLYSDNLNCKRGSAYCLLSVCQNSRKKYDIVFWLLNELFKNYYKSEENRKPVFLKGTFLCLKTLIPVLKNLNFPNEIEKHRDSSLSFKDRKTIANQVDSIKKNLIVFYYLFLNELNINNDSQVIYNLLEFLQVLLKSLPKVFLNFLETNISHKFELKFDSDEDDQMKQQLIESFYSSILKQNDEKYIDFTLKLICVKFLLNDDLGNNLKTDNEVKVSVKSLVLSCISELVEYQPYLLSLKIYEKNDIKVIEILKFSNHQDPNLVGHTSLIVSSFIKSKLAVNSYNCKNLTREEQELIVKLFFEHIYLPIDNQSSVQLKLVLTSIKKCINEIIKSNLVINFLIKDLFKKLVSLNDHPYWLIKIELLEIFSSLNYKIINYTEKNVSKFFAIDSKIQKSILNNIFYKFLIDKDYRVRSSCIKNLIKLIPKLYFKNNHETKEDEILSFANTTVLNQNPKNTKIFNHLFNLNSDQYKKLTIFPEDLLIYNYGFVFPFTEKFNLKKIEDANLSFIFNEFTPNYNFENIQYNLKIIISHLISNLLEKIDDKLTLIGILECLSELTDYFPTTKFAKSWNIDSYKSTKLIDFLLSYLTTTQSAILDLNSHSLFLKLITSLVSGKGYHEIKNNSLFKAKSKNSIFEKSSQSFLEELNKSKNFNSEDLFDTKSKISKTQVYDSSFSVSSLDQVNDWGLLGNLDFRLSSILQKLTTYLIKLLQIYSNVFNENNTETTKSFLNQVFKPSFSPLKRTNSKASDIFDKTDLFKKFTDKDKVVQTFKKDNINFQNSYSNDANLVKLHEVIKKLHTSTISTLDFLKYEQKMIDKHQNKLINFFDEIINSFLKVLELGNYKYFSKLSDELIYLIQSIFPFQSVNCVKFLKQLTKVLFGVNFSKIYEYQNEISSEEVDLDSDSISYSSFLNDSLEPIKNNTEVNNDLHSVCVLNEYNTLKEKILSSSENTNKFRCELEKKYYNVFYKKIFDKRMKAVLSQNYNEFLNENVIANYIQSFEPFILDLMKLYTCRSDIKLHCYTINFIDELVKLHISYNSLDQNQTFFVFLRKQFEFIESEQISSSFLVESLFSFLICLSYEKPNPTLINYSQVIQLMGNIQASEANFDENVYPALKLIVEDLFLIRTISNSEPLRELETQKEFIINLLFKLIHIPKVIFLLNIILIEYKLEGEDKVKKLSRQITDHILSCLKKGLIVFESYDDVNIVTKLFSLVSPVVFRPVDFVLNGFFSLFDDNILNSNSNFINFYSHKLILLNVLISNSKEDITLNRLNELKLNLINSVLKKKINSNMIKEEEEEFYSLPIFYLNIKSLKNQKQQPDLSEEIISKFLLKLIALPLLKIVDNKYSFCVEENFKFKQFLTQLLSRFLINIQFIVKESYFPKIKDTLTKLLINNYGGLKNTINQFMKFLVIEKPILILQWISILKNINFDLEKEFCDSLNEVYINDFSVLSSQKSLLEKKFEKISFSKVTFLQNNSFLINFLKIEDNNEFEKRIKYFKLCLQLQLIKKNQFLMDLNYLDQKLLLSPKTNLLNKKILIFLFSKQNDQCKKILEIIRLDEKLSIKFLEEMNDQVLSFSFFKNSVFILEKFLVFCSSLHEKTCYLLVDFLIQKLFLNEEFYFCASLRKLMIEIVNQKLKNLNFIKERDSQKLNPEQITSFLKQLKSCNKSGVSKYVNKTLKLLEEYYNALDLFVEEEKEDFQETTSAKVVDEDSFKSSKEENIYKSDFLKTDTLSNHKWLLDAVLKNETFNNSQKMFKIFNSYFSVSELLSILENKNFTKNSRQIIFASKGLENINEILELNLNFDIKPHSSLKILKNSQFSLVLAIRKLVFKKFNPFLESINYDMKKSNKYFIFLHKEELLFEEEIENYKKICTLYDSKAKRKDLINLSNLFAIFLKHIDLIIKFDEVRKKCILNNQDILKNEENIEKLIKFENLDYNIILRIAMFYCELLQYGIFINDESYVDDCVVVIKSLTKSDFLMNILSSYELNSMQYTLISSVYLYYKKKFNNYEISDDEKLIPIHFSNPEENNLCFKHSKNTCLKMKEMINFILKQSSDIAYKANQLVQNKKLYSDVELDNFIFTTLVLARLPFVNRFLLIPSAIWSNKTWQPKFSVLKSCTKEDNWGEKYYGVNTFCSTMPSDQLLEPEILQTFINLLNLIGFTNRIQFEEIWVSLLGVILVNNDFIINEKNTGNEEILIEEINEKAYLIVLAIKGITSIILQCSLSEIGFPVKSLKQRFNRTTESLLDDYSRKKVYLNTKFGNKLLYLNKHLSFDNKDKFNYFFKFSGIDMDVTQDFFEKLIFGELNYNYLNLVQFSENYYENRYGLYSTEYLKKKLGLIKETSDYGNLSPPSYASTSGFKSDSNLMNEDFFYNKLNEKDSYSFSNKLGIDVNSCIRSLIELFGSMFKSHIVIQVELLKSVIKISDLFLDLNLFNKNIDIFFDLYKTAYYQEDEILLQYLILGICKFYAVYHECLNETVVLEKIKKCVDISLKSKFFPTRINCLVGLNYILQDKLNAISKGRTRLIKDNQLFVMLKDYVSKSLFDEKLAENIEHAVLVWNSAFLLVDQDEEFDENEFNQKLFRQILIILSGCKNNQIYTIVTNGVQNLLVSEFFRIRECNKIVQICIEKLKKDPFFDFQTIACFHILITSIYVFGLLPNGLQSNLDEGILNFENINILFSCLKKTDCNENYYKLILKCLPDISVDFIPDQNLLNKVISEFLANQKNNVKFFAIILHRVITKLQKQSKQTLVNDWVCLSVKSFTQIKPLEYAISSLLALMISASNNFYTRSLFECLINDFGKFSFHQQKLLKTVIKNYLEELNSENTKLLLNTFKTESNDDPFYKEINEELFFDTS